MDWFGARNYAITGNEMAINTWYVLELMFFTGFIPSLIWTGDNNFMVFKMTLFFGLEFVVPS